MKRAWEEPFSQRVFGLAAGRSGAGPGDALRVIDIGSGTGDALRLLEAALGPGPGAPAVEYLGLDVDPSMVELGRDIHRGRDGVDFELADVRDGVPPRAADLYLSSGVPYSHLTGPEMESVLADIFRTVKNNHTRSAVVLDVLGRYSIEWVPNWPSDRWNYEMTFFRDVKDSPQAPMTFYSRATLDEMIRKAGIRAGLVLSEIDYFDRSVVVGRHTETGTFNPGLPPYRSLLNRLFGGDTEVDLAELELKTPRQDSPAEVAEFFAGYSTEWNSCLRKHVARHANREESPESRRELAGQLRVLEFEMQRGLGVGHSLICVVSADGRDG
ncbi:class I SAM-dependent methyltransferase [Amycolatopsis sp. NPDC054798]